MSSMRPAAILLLLTLPSAFGQAAGNTGVQEKVAAIKQSMAQNQTQLKLYTWVETTAVSLKGEVKKTEQKTCRYGADGKVVKTPIAGAPPAKAPEPASSGRRGGRSGKVKEKVIANKVEDMKEYMEKAAALVKQYVPPNPQTLQASLNAGKAAIDKASGQVVFNDYAMAGDKMTLSFDPAAKSLSSFTVASYLDKPEDTVTLNANFSKLDDGTTFMKESVLNVKAKDIVVRTTNSQYQKSAH